MLESVTYVREALHAAALRLPGRNPRQTKAFVNLWRFYMSLDHRVGLINPARLAVERHSIEMARVVELMIRWPYLLDTLGKRLLDGSERPPTNLSRLIEVCDASEEAWAEATADLDLDPTKSSVKALRLLLREVDDREIFLSITRRYL